MNPRKGSQAVMRRHRTITATALTLALLGGLLGSSSPARGNAPDGQVEQSYSVKTKWGNLYVEAVHPTFEGDMLKVPTIMTLSPYSILGRNGDAGRWVPRGYNRIYVDVIGTGNSGGCWDYGGIREKETGRTVVEWIAKQKWSDGKVAMIGSSYNGTTATSTAVMRPKGLTTIVPEAAISRWYDYAYSGGIRYFLNGEAVGHQGPGAVTDEGFDTPLAFDFGLAIPPPTDVESADWAERVQSTIVPCDELEHTMAGYDDTPDYDKFWLERDYIKDAKKIDIPVLVAHNWGDWNVKQEEGFNLFKALKNAPQKVLYMGTRWQGHGTPGGEYDAFVDAWMDHYLKDMNNGIQNAPQVISQTSDKEGAAEKFTSFRRYPKTKNLVLYAQNVVIFSDEETSWQLRPSKPQESFFGGAPVASFPSTNVNTEAHAAHHARSNHDWFWFESPILKRDLRVFGEVKMQIYSKVRRKWITFTPSLLDVNPADHTVVVNQHVLTCDITQTDCRSELVGVSRGWLDSRYRNGLDKQVEIKPNKNFEMTVTLKPQDYTFRKGNYLGVNIQTEINEWSIPKPYPGCEDAQTIADPRECASIVIDWLAGRTRLILPVIGLPKNPNDVFDLLGHQHGD